MFASARRLRAEPWRGTDARASSTAVASPSDRSGPSAIWPPSVESGSVAVSSGSYIDVSLFGGVASGLRASGAPAAAVWLVIRRASYAIFARTSHSSGGYSAARGARWLPFSSTVFSRTSCFAWTHTLEFRAWLGLRRRPPHTTCVHFWKPHPNAHIANVRRADIVDPMAALMAGMSNRLAWLAFSCQCHVVPCSPTSAGFSMSHAAPAASAAAMALALNSTSLLAALRCR